MVIVRRNPLQAAVGSLLAVGLLVSGILAVTGNIQPAATSCDASGYGFQAGYGYGYTFDAIYGYGCPSTTTVAPTTAAPTTATTLPVGNPDRRLEDGYCLVAND